jgi:hypothetical protein
MTKISGQASDANVEGIISWILAYGRPYIPITNYNYSVEDKMKD